jgi:hypothetical protein
VEELDAEMADYFPAPEGNNEAMATTGAEGVQATAGGDTAMDDEMLWVTTRRDWRLSRISSLLDLNLYGSQNCPRVERPGFAIFCLSSGAFYSQQIKLLRTLGLVPSIVDTRHGSVSVHYSSWTISLQFNRLFSKL